MTEEKWVLKDGDSYFKMWTQIGPCGTDKLEEAAVFPSKEDAMRSLAYTFMLTNYEPVSQEKLNP